ncbi:MAG TPA: cytochrome c [Lysobacter sp.]
MRGRRLKFLSVSIGLVAWAVVLVLRMNPATDLAALQASTPAREALVDPAPSPARLYASSCASCHQGQGEGRFPVFPPLTGSPWVNGDADRLIALTLHGLSGPIEVNGVDYSGLMPGFAHLGDAEVAALLTHIRGGWGNGAAAVSAEDVAAVRTRTAHRRGPWTADELMAEGEDRP